MPQPRGVDWTDVNDPNRTSARPKFRIAASPDLIPANPLAPALPAARDFRWTKPPTRVTVDAGICEGTR